MSSAPDEIYQSLPLPEYKVGWVIGKRGSYIKQLEKKSGALISISETTTFEHDLVWKFVHISGHASHRETSKDAFKRGLGPWLLEIQYSKQVLQNICCLNCSDNLRA